MLRLSAGLQDCDRYHILFGASGLSVIAAQCKQGSVISSADWKLDPQELASKFNSKTKMIIINNPNNPLGKVSPCLQTT